MKQSLTLILVFLSHFVVAQKISVRGVVADKTDQQPIEYATISFHSALDSQLIDGTVSDAAGQFELAWQPKENFYVAIQFIGYSLYVSPPWILHDHTI